MAGVRDKLQDEDVLSFILDFDLVWLLETKTALNFNVPGYNVYLNPSKLNVKRGGVAMLLKCSFLKYVKNIDMSCEGQIWLELSCYPEYIFGGIYISPNDSPYFEPALFGSLMSNTMQYSKVIIMGDFNSRVGEPSMVYTNENVYEYSGIKDVTLNANGKQLLDICKASEMVVANHLVVGNKTLGGNLSYRQGENWVSEIDLCLIKSKIVGVIQDVIVDQRIHGSDHAPLVATFADFVAKVMF